MNGKRMTLEDAAEARRTTRAADRAAVRQLMAAVQREARAGTGATEIARRTGLSRRQVYNLIEGRTRTGT